MDEMEQLKESLWPKPVEPLRPELEVVKVRAGGKWQLRHPLCWVNDYDQKYNYSYNAAFEEKTQNAADAKAVNDWLSYLRIHEKTCWPTALKEMRAFIAPNEWAAVVRDAWIDSDKFWCNLDAWRDIACAAKGRDGLMTEREREHLRNMSQSVTIFRGCRTDNLEGLSWTISVDWAGIFAHTARGVVWRGTARKADIIAFFDKHGEEKEIVILPEHVSGKRLLD